MFEKAEMQYIENLRASLPPKWRPMTRVLWALVFGLAVQPNVKEEDLKAAETILRRAWPRSSKA